MWATITGVGERELVLQGLIMSLGVIRGNNSLGTQFVQQIVLIRSFLDPDLMDLLTLGHPRVSEFPVLEFGVVLVR